jgi:hypothetical protein
MSPDIRKDFNKEEDSEDSLEVFKENLYSRNENFHDRAEAPANFRPHDLDQVPKDWGGSSLNDKTYFFQHPERRMSFLKKMLIASIVFLLASVGVASYVFFAGGNIISTDNVDISVTGPVSVSGGEMLPLQISVTNQNNADLQTSTLIVDYPDGTRDSFDTNLSLQRYREDLGTVKKGAIATRKIQAVLFGEEKDVKVIKVSVEYRLSGSNAIFSKKKDYTVTISSSPVTLTVDSVKDANAGQEVEFTINVISNSSQVIKNLGLSAEYPFGFTFSNSDPKPAWSNSFWDLGDVKAGVKKTIKVRGTLTGQDNEERTFHFSVGTQSPTNDNAIGTNFLTGVRKITIKKPFIGTLLAIDGDSSDLHISKSGKVMRADLTLSNNAGVKITDAKISVRLAGNIFDQNSVTVDNGFYRSSDRTITWDQTLKPALATINPEGEANISFSFATKPESEVRLLASPQMSVVVTVTGKRLTESGLSQDITSTVTKVVKVASSLGLSSRALYYSGVFNNAGPIPPKVDSETNYTIVWSLTNGSNPLSNVKVTATLPSYMKWVNNSSPASEKITYNPIGGTIVWDVGDLKLDTGFSNSPREISFQIAITPSASQVGTTPTLISETTATGDDNFAGQSVQSGTVKPLTTDLTTDIGFLPGQGKVVK